MEQLFEFFKLGLQSEFAKAGIITVIFSGIVYAIRGYISEIFYFIGQNIKSTVTFRSDGSHYDIFSQYLLTILPKTHYDSNSKIATGTYYRMINGNFSVIYIWVEKLMDRYIHTITITSYFSRTLPEFINGKLKELSADKIKISTNSHYVEPKTLPKKNKVLLPTESGKKLYKIIEKILKSDLSRAGILLYGEPGSGKSRAIVEIAQKFGMNIKFICINSNTNLENVQEALQNNEEDIDLFDAEVKTNTLGTPMRKIGSKWVEQKKFKPVKKKYIVLLEDIDRLHLFQKEDTEQKYNLTKVDLLNTFDGIFAPENCIIIATANDFNKIEPALIRAGRFDIHLKFQNPSLEEIYKLYKTQMGKGNPEFTRKNKGKSLADVFNAIKMEKLKAL